MSRGLGMRREINDALTVVWYEIETRSKYDTYLGDQTFVNSRIQTLRR